MSQSFWSSVSTYCEELAPVAGPLLAAVGATADAIERADKQTKSLNASTRTLRRGLASASPEDE
jgi:hypothetical protein